MAKQKTPWHDDDYVYFELQTPEFEAFDAQNEGGLYSVPKFEPGVYQLPIDAIREATAQERRKRKSQIISVDSCQMFLVDKSRVAMFREALDAKEGLWPNYPYFERLRRKIGVDFGFASLTADGTYVIDIAQLDRVSQGRKARPKKGKAATQDPYEKVARRMRTFICERCFKEELMDEIGDPALLAALAKVTGWLLLPPAGKTKSGFFEEFQVVGPKCAAKG